MQKDVQFTSLAILIILVILVISFLSYFSYKLGHNKVANYQTLDTPYKYNNQYNSSYNSQYNSPYNNQYNIRHKAVRFGLEKKRIFNEETNSLLDCAPTLAKSGDADLNLKDPLYYSRMMTASI